VQVAHAAEAEHVAGERGLPLDATAALPRGGDAEALAFEEVEDVCRRDEPVRGAHALPGDGGEDGGDGVAEGLAGEGRGHGCGSCLPIERASDAALAVIHLPEGKT